MIQVPPPEPPPKSLQSYAEDLLGPLNDSRKSSREKSEYTLQSSSRKTSNNDIISGNNYSPNRKVSNSPKNNIQHHHHNENDYNGMRKASDVLSRESALNERYFDNNAEKVRSRSLDNLLGVESPPSPTNLADMGLSQSRLNDRYHSVEQLTGQIDSVLAVSNSTYMSKQEMDFEYPDINSSVGTSNRGTPRYIKSQYAGKRAPVGSHSSRAHIEKNLEFSGAR